MIRFLLQNLKKVNCPFTPQNFVCAPCDGTKSSAFDPQGSIVLCQNGFSSKSHLETTMAHELIHAFDNW
jgi:inner membrane protease ATP23